MSNYKEFIKVIGFDLDQTLYPKSPEIDEAIQGYLYEKIAEHLNVSYEEGKRLFIDLYQDGHGLSGSKTLAKLGVPNGSNLVQEALENADIATFLKPNLKVIELIQKLKETYTHIDIITGSNKQICTTKLAHLELPQILFSHILTDEDGSKSSGEAYKLWLSLYPTLSPDQFLYIGDRAKTDYFVPKEIGIHTILVNQKESSAEIDCPQYSSLLDITSLLL